MKMTVALDSQEVNKILTDYLSKKFPKKILVYVALTEEGGAEASLEDYQEQTDS